jgi:hypothetical protein
MSITQAMYIYTSDRGFDGLKKDRGFDVTIRLCLVGFSSTLLNRLIRLLCRRRSQKVALSNGT